MPACCLDLLAVAGSGGRHIGRTQADGPHLCRRLHRVDTSLRLRLCRVRVRRLDSIVLGERFHCIGLGGRLQGFIGEIYRCDVAF